MSYEDAEENSCHYRGDHYAGPGRASLQWIRAGAVSINTNPHYRAITDDATRDTHSKSDRNTRSQWNSRANEYPVANVYAIPYLHAISHAHPSTRTYRNARTNSNSCTYRRATNAGG